MATVTRTPARSAFEGLSPYRLTVRQFETMMDAGVFPDDARVELLGGILVEQMTKHAPHDFAIMRLAKLLEALVEPAWVVRQEKAVVLGRDWRPEPDLAVAAGPDDRYRKTQPRAKELALVVEVSESTYPTDSGRKLVGYAGARVSAYWVVNLGRRAVEVYTDPVGRGEAATYRTAATYGPEAEIPVAIGGREAGKIAVTDVLP